MGFKQYKSEFKVTDKQLVITWVVLDQLYLILLKLRKTEEWLSGLAGAERNVFRIAPYIKLKTLLQTREGYDIVTKEGHLKLYG